MDLIDEENVVFLKVGEQGGQIAWPLEYRPRGLAQLYAHFVRDDVRKRRLAKARGAEQQHVVQRFAATPGGLDEDLQLLTNAMLADVFLQRTRPQRPLDGVLVGRGAL